MSLVNEGKLTFHFPEDWQATKFDDWSFYRKQFQKVCTGTKAVDILAISSGSEPCLWVIEVKDYRGNPLPRPSDLPGVVACKVRDSLAMLVAARYCVTDENQKFAEDALRCKKLRVVLHLEQDRSQFSQLATNPANVLMKLKQLIKSIDPHPQIHPKNSLPFPQWTVKYGRKT